MSAKPRLNGITAAPDGDRLPPQHLEAEQAVLGSILLDGAVFELVAEIIHADDFFRDAYQVMFRAMARLHADGKGIDAVTLHAELRRRGHVDRVGGHDGLAEVIESVPHSANAKYYAEIVKEKSQLRSVIDQASAILKRAYAGESTARDLLASVERMYSESADEDDEEPSRVTPAPMAKAAFDGLAGEMVGLIKPESEACREAILTQFMVAFGACVGRNIFYRHEATRHRCSLFLCLYGPTGVGRKGTSWHVAKWLLRTADPEWERVPILSGLSSGEGLMRALNESDGGRAIVAATEFGGLLSNMGREGNNLCALVRDAWDGDPINIPTKSAPVKLEDYHLGIIGHITESELRQRLKGTEIDNGFVNRFMWVHTYRDGILPDGGDFESAAAALSPLQSSLSKVAGFARDLSITGHRYERDSRAKELWREFYTKTAKEPRIGPYGNATVRANGIIVRLSTLYALLDRSRVVTVTHLERAMAFWSYCDRSARYLFDEQQANDDLDALVKGLSKPMTRHQIRRQIFSAHLSADEIDRLLAEGMSAGLLAMSTSRIGGRERSVWSLKGGADER